MLQGGDDVSVRSVLFKRGLFREEWANCNHAVLAALGIKLSFSKAADERVAFCVGANVEVHTDTIEGRTGVGR